MITIETAKWCNTRHIPGELRRTIRPLMLHTFAQKSSISSEEALPLTLEPNNTQLAHMTFHVLTR